MLCSRLSFAASTDQQYWQQPVTSACMLKSAGARSIRMINIEVVSDTVWCALHAGFVGADTAMATIDTALLVLMHLAADAPTSQF